MGGKRSHFLLLYSSVAFTLYVGKVKFPLLLFRSSVFWVSHARFTPEIFIVLKHCTICIFLIHFLSLQKILTALFILVWNTQKTTWTIFFEWQGKMFFNIGEDKWKATLNALDYCFLHIFKIKVSNFYWPITWEI